MLNLGKCQTVLGKNAEHCVQADKGGLSPPFQGFSAFGRVRPGFFLPNPALAATDYCTCQVLT